MDVDISVNLTTSTPSAAASDDAMVATAVLAITRVFAIDANSLQVVDVSNEGGAIVRFDLRARVSETAGPADMSETRCVVVDRARRHTGVTRFAHGARRLDAVHCDVL